MFCCFDSKCTKKKSNLDYPDLNYLDFLIIWTFSSPNFVMNIYCHDKAIFFLKLKH